MTNSEITEYKKLEFLKDLRKVMRLKNIRPFQLADILHMSPEQTSHILNGRNAYKLATMVRLSESINCDIEIKIVPR